LHRRLYGELTSADVKFLLGSLRIMDKNNPVEPSFLTPTCSRSRASRPPTLHVVRPPTAGGLTQAFIGTVVAYRPGMIVNNRAGRSKSFKEKYRTARSSRRGGATCATPSESTPRTKDAPPRDGRADWPPLGTVLAPAVGLSGP